MQRPLFLFYELVSNLLRILIYNYVVYHPVLPLVVIAIMNSLSFVRSVKKNVERKVVTVLCIKPFTPLDFAKAK